MTSNLLIIRQQKAEIERLKKEYAELEDRYSKEGIVKNEAIERMGAALLRLRAQMSDIHLMLGKGQFVDACNYLTGLLRPADETPDCLRTDDDPLKPPEPL